MAGEDITSEVTESADLILNGSERKKRNLGQNLFGILFHGFFLSIPIMFTLLGIISLLLFVIRPLETWAVANTVNAIFFEIPIDAFILLSLFVVVYIVGRINRGGTEAIWEISLPKNNKWLLGQGFLVYILGTALQISLIRLKICVESSLEYWSEQFPGSSGDFIVGIITGPIMPVAMILTGILGYLIATRFPIFRDV